MPDATGRQGRRLRGGDDPEGAFDKSLGDFDGEIAREREAHGLGRQGLRPGRRRAAKPVTPAPSRRRAAQRRFAARRRRCRRAVPTTWAGADSGGAPRRHGRVRTSGYAGAERVDRGRRGQTTKCGTASVAQGRDGSRADRRPGHPGRHSGGRHRRGPGRPPAPRGSHGGEGSRSCAKRSGNSIAATRASRNEDRPTDAQPARCRSWWHSPAACARVLRRRATSSTNPSISSAPIARSRRPSCSTSASCCSIRASPRAMPIPKSLVFPEVRRAESRYMPYHLKTTLEASGQWGSVWVLPEKSDSVDVLVWGAHRSLRWARRRSQSRRLGRDGREWLNKTYKTRVPGEGLLALSRPEPGPLPEYLQRDCQ